MTDLDIVLVTARDIPVSDQDDAPLLAALRDRGLRVGLWVWDDPDRDWSAPRMAVVRTTWDYELRRDEFLAWAEKASSHTALFNPIDVLRWNTHKSYLIELEERGAPVVPTAWLGQGDDVDLATLLEGRRWDDAVIKPAVAAGARGLRRVQQGETSAAQTHLDALLADGDVMIQPYLRGIEQHGELSVVVIDGTYSHAVLKRPSAGDFRIQVEFGGQYSEVTPDDDTIRLAEWIVETTGHDLLYARVDLVPDVNGAPMLSELEATEPSLYLDYAAGAPARMAEAIVTRLDGLG